MKIGNALIYCEDHVFRKGVIDVQDGIIIDISLENETKNFDIDGKGGYIIPGLVDIHFHGCMGADLCDGSYESIEKMARYEEREGVTTICPATMTLSISDIHNVMKAVAGYENFEGAYFAGINMEGPFISKEKKGAQSAENIISCNTELFKIFQEESGNRIKLVDIAPEEPCAMEFIKELHNDVVVSVAHTKADYDIANDAFKVGAKHVTHLFNAMSPFLHRDPGVIGAAVDAGVTVELICDGIHIHPAMVRSAFKLFGAEKICLISDSMRATGLGDGKYALGGQTVYVNGSVAMLEDGTIAGSVTNLMECMKKAVKEFGIPLEDVIRCASENPAKVIGVFDRVGSISIGKRADMVLLDKDLNLLRVFS